MTGNIDLLDDEMTRPQPAGIRVFSVGILRLCRKLGLNFALSAAEQKALTEEEAAREMLAACYLLDAANPLDVVRALAELGREVFFERLDDYEFTVEPALLQRVQLEMHRTQRAVSAVAFEIEPKPGGPASAAPRGK